MRWISRECESMGVKWKLEGWYFDKPKEDYRTELRCKKCSGTQRVDEGQKEEVRGYSGDGCGAPVFYLHCARCYNILAIIDEGVGEFRPRLELFEGGEFLNPLVIVKPCP